VDKQTFRDGLDAVLTFAAGLVPGAFGAAIAVAYEKTMTWAERFSAVAIGIIVSYFAGLAFVAVMDPHPFMERGFSFSVGLVAYKATPAFIHAAVEAIKGVPKAILDKVGLGSKA
jgi:hypothetical protein